MSMKKHGDSKNHFLTRVPLWAALPAVEAKSVGALGDRRIAFGRLAGAL